MYDFGIARRKREREAALREQWLEGLTLYDLCAVITRLRMDIAIGSVSKSTPSKPNPVIGRFWKRLKEIENELSTMKLGWTRFVDGVDVHMENMLTAKNSEIVALEKRVAVLENLTPKETTALVEDQELLHRPIIAPQDPPGDAGTFNLQEAINHSGATKDQIEGLAKLGIIDKLKDGPYSRYRVSDIEDLRVKGYVPTIKSFQARRKGGPYFTTKEFLDRSGLCEEDLKYLLKREIIAPDHKAGRNNYFDEPTLARVQKMGYKGLLEDAKDD